MLVCVGAGAVLVFLVLDVEITKDMSESIRAQ